MNDGNGIECWVDENDSCSKNIHVDVQHSTSISKVLSAAYNLTYLIKFKERDRKEVQTTNTTKISVLNMDILTTVDLVDKLGMPHTNLEFSSGIRNSQIELGIPQSN